MRTLMAHQAGLQAVARPLPPGYNLTDWDGMCAALAEQEPWWEPGTNFGYHTNTYRFPRRRNHPARGRATPEPVPPGGDRRTAWHRFPLRLRAGARPRAWPTWIPYVRARRAKRTTVPGSRRTLPRCPGSNSARLLAYGTLPGARRRRELANLARERVPIDERPRNARASPTSSAALAHDGSWRRPPRPRPRSARRGDPHPRGRRRRGARAAKPLRPGLPAHEPRHPAAGTGPRAFGHYGNGAVLGFGDPDGRIAFAYVCNRAGRSWRDPRNIALVDAALRRRLSLVISRRHWRCWLQDGHQPSTFAFQLHPW